MHSEAKRSSERMRTKFVKLIKTIMSALEEKIAEGKTDLDEVKTYFSIQYPNHEKQLLDAQSVNELLKVTHRDFSFTNPDFLDALTDMFVLQEEKKKVEQYNDDLKNYNQEDTNKEVSRVDWKQGLTKYTDCWLVGIHKIP